MKAIRLAVITAVAYRSLLSASCDATTLTVSHMDANAYQSLQAAVDALPENGGDIILAPGLYREKVRVTKLNVHIRGTGREPSDTVIVFGDGAINVGGTFHSATLDASGDNFHLENLTVQNDYSLNPANPPSQAVALSATGDHGVFRRVRLLGAQDTLFSNKGPKNRMSRQYFTDCYIEGHVDFIFGNAKAYFAGCELHGIAHQSVMFTAQSKGAPEEDSAYVFNNFTITADPNALDISLGRAWRPFATVIFLNTKIIAPIIPDGWREWTPGKTDTLKTATFAEYRSMGPGANPAAREPYSHQLTDSESRQWSLNAFFHGDTSWISRNP